MLEAGWKILKSCHLWIRKIATQRMRLTARGHWEGSLGMLASAGSRVSLALFSTAGKQDLCARPNFMCMVASKLWPLSTEVRCKPTCKHCCVSCPETLCYTSDWLHLDPGLPKASLQSSAAVQYHFWPWWNVLDLHSTGYHKPQMLTEHLKCG